MKHAIKLMLAIFALCGASQGYAAETTRLHGVNLPQAAFGEQHIPGIPNKDYMWPSVSDTVLYGAMGANILRVSFLWERMQPELSEPLQSRELAQLDALVSTAAAQKITILLDVHNYAAYNKNLIGSDAVPVSAFTDLWSRLAAHYKDQPYVAFGLMNEPVTQTAEDWAAIAQQTLDAIRKTGAKQLVLVPGTIYSGAHSWTAKHGQMSNAEALATIKDPANNFEIEVHQYFDDNSSGTHPTCVSEDIGVERLAGFTAWLRKTGHKGFLGEFGASQDPVCLRTLEKTLRYMAANADVWDGWTYWAAAAWFGNYMFNIYPPDPARFPQVEILKQAMQGEK